MRIALIAEWLDPWRGGAETSTLQFIHRLVDHGINLRVFTRSRLSPTPRMDVHMVSSASLSRTRRTMTFAHRVRQTLRSESFDLVHAVSPFCGADLYQPRGGTLAETVERNLALLRNGSARSMKKWLNRLNLKQRHLLRYERRMLGGAHPPIVVAISGYVARQFRHHYRMPADRIRLVFNGVEPDRATELTREADRRSIRAEYGLSGDDCLVLVMAHNFRLKGVARWMEALSLLRWRGVRNIRSLVIGKGDSRVWHQRAARLGIDDLLTFVGPTDRVAAFRHAGDVLVHPTYYDPCSRVVLEGMCSGLPCITTRWDGAAEMIEDGKNGYVLSDPWCVETLAGLVEQLRAESLRSRIGSEAVKIANRVSMSRHTESMIRLYQSMIHTAVSR